MSAIRVSHPSLKQGILSNRFVSSVYLNNRYIAYIRPKFNKAVAKVLAHKKYSMLDAMQVKAVMMLLHAGYINTRLKEEVFIPELLGGVERYTSYVRTLALICSFRVLPLCAMHFALRPMGWLVRAS